MKKYFSIIVLFHFFLSTLVVEANMIHKKELYNIKNSPDYIKLFFESKDIDITKVNFLMENSSKTYPIYLSEANLGLIYYADVISKENNKIAREFYYTKYDSTSGKWVTPLNISNDYETFYRENKKLNFEELYVTINNDIYVINLKEEKFNITSLNINSKSIETSPAISPDGNTLFFVSDRKNGMGGKDIYACERLTDRSWSTPYNLGRDINTAEDEESPFMMTDGASLYFSSKGHDTNGGFDIFETTQTETGLWLSPQKINAPLNSAYDEYFFIINSKGSVAFYTSEKNQCEHNDIYSVTGQIIY